MKRKTINAVFSDLEGGYNNQLWQENHRAAQEQDLNLVVFEGRSIDNPGTDHQHNIIYDLVRRVPCDGFFLMSAQISNYVDPARVQAFCEPLVRTGKPILSAGELIAGTTSLLVDNKTGMDAMMDHLIEQHGYRRIAFVKGPEQHHEAIARFDSYCDALRRHGIPFDDRLVQPGDFSPNAGRLAIAALHQNDLLPVDCVVCANDETAMGVYEYFRQAAKAGTPLPPIHVTGFDNTSNAQNSRPSLTTIAQPFGRIADEAFRLLADPDARLEDKTLYFPAEPIFRESCGCPPTAESLFSDDLFVMATRNYRIHQTMQTFSLEELYQQVAEVLPLCGIGDCFIVKYDEPVTYPEQEQIPDQAILLFAHQDGCNVLHNRTISFSTDNLLPDMCYPQDRRFTWIVKPLFFQNEHLGYMVFEPTSTDTRNYEPIRGQISNTIKVALLLLKQSEIEARLAGAVEELQEFNWRLNRLSVRDELSGVYNRRGFFESATKVVDLNNRTPESVLLLFADIDNMKMINDQYGHSEGDQAIRATVSILKRAFRSDDIIARMGGDEFVVLAKQLSENNVSSVRERIQTFTREYNEQSGKPYQLEFSLGIATVNPDVHQDLEELLRLADTRQYEEKRRKKGGAPRGVCYPPASQES